MLVPRPFPRGRVGKGTGPVHTQTQCTLRWPKVIGLLVHQPQLHQAGNGNKDVDV